MFVFGRVFKIGTSYILQVLTLYAFKLILVVTVKPSKFAQESNLFGPIQLFANQSLYCDLYIYTI